MPSHFRALSWETIWETPWRNVQLPDSGQVFELDVEDLPLLREQLELKLKQLDVADRVNGAVRDKLAGHLRGVEKVEALLAERDD